MCLNCVMHQIRFAIATGNLEKAEELTNKVKKEIFRLINKNIKNEDHKKELFADLENKDVSETCVNYRNKRRIQ